MFGCSGSRSIAYNSGGLRLTKNINKDKLINLAKITAVALCMIVAFAAIIAGAISTYGVGLVALGVVGKIMLYSGIVVSAGTPCAGLVLLGKKEQTNPMVFFSEIEYKGRLRR